MRAVRWYGAGDVRVEEVPAPGSPPAGMVVVADGTPLAAEKLERVLTTDPAMGVLRHVDAGYERAIEVARERGIHVPMPPDA